MPPAIACQPVYRRAPRGAIVRLAARAALLLLSGVGAAGGLAASEPAGDHVSTLDPVSVQAGTASMVGNAESANAGIVTRAQIEARTNYRAAEMLEAIPGLVVTQHSGEGKATQLYLRGFNLDHGTDLRTTVDGMLVNQRSHSHGHGWTDLNFLIPELVSRIDFHKGPFYANEGDFSAAGAAALVYADRLPKGIASLGLGQHGFRRALLADSPKFGDGHLLYALESMRNDGPWVHPDRFHKTNAVLRYSEGTAVNGFNLSLMAYAARWNATDQIPLRAVDDGSLSRLDTIDPSSGGRAARYSLSGAWRRSTDAGLTRVQAYLIQRSLDLYSNFTYFLDDPLRGDQFAQPDRRNSAGFQLSHTWQHLLGGRESETVLGLQFEHDNIRNGLNRTQARQLLSVTRQDRIRESSLAAYAETTTYWTDRARTIAGLRGDSYRFRVRSDRADNSGDASAGIVSPKFALIFGPWNKTEVYFHAGHGFHSNDARGTTIRVDPASGDPVDRVAALARIQGREIGLRTEYFAGMHTTLSLYELTSASELLFVGDAGTTEASRPSRRTGIELAHQWRVDRNWTLDAAYAHARARFRDADPAGSFIPGAVEGVGSLALSFSDLGPWSGALQLRLFGPRPLIEDNSVRSRGTRGFNGRIGYRIDTRTRVEAEIFNLTNRRDSAIDYYYESQLRNEAAPVGDIHFHPVEPRSLRITLTHQFR